MITTTFLFLLITFEIWYLSSKQYKQKKHSVLVTKIKSNKKQFRIGTFFLFLIAATLLILKLGWGSGIAAVIFLLMAAGSLIVTIQPFRYMRVTTIAILYFSILLLEIFI